MKIPRGREMLRSDNSSRAQTYGFKHTPESRENGSRNLRLLQPLLLHLLAQRQWTHVSPYFFDIGQAICFWTTLAGIFPAQRVFPVSRPDGVLFFMIDDNFVDGFIFCFFRHRVFSLKISFVVSYRLDRL